VNFSRRGAREDLGSPGFFRQQLGRGGKKIPDYNLGRRGAGGEGKKPQTDRVELGGTLAVGGKETGKGGEVGITQTEGLGRKIFCNRKFTAPLYPFFWKKKVGLQGGVLLGRGYGRS